MKLKLATILFALTAMISMTSCEDEHLGQGELPPISGEVVLSDVLATDGARVSPNYVFTLELGTEGATKTGSGVVFEAIFVCKSVSLEAGTYTEASASSATSGKYITGADGTKLYIDGKMHLVTAGTITVNVDGNAYAITGILKLDNDENYMVEWNGSDLKWGDLPTLKKLTTVTGAQSNVANGTKSVTVSLSDGNWKENVTYDENWQATYTYEGKGNYLAVDFYSEDGYLAPGTYKPSAAGGVINPGEYGIGWDPGDLWGIGMIFSDWGTCWWTVDASAETPKTAQEISTGNITVELSDKVYTITLDNGEIYAQFVGEIPALTKPEAPQGGGNNGDTPNDGLEGDTVIRMSGLTYSITDDTAANTTADGAALSGVTLYYVELKDASDNIVAIFDLVTEQGAQSVLGNYTVASYPDAVGEAGNGFDLRSWGMDMWGGTILTDAEGTNYSINVDSTIEVKESRGAVVFIVKGTYSDATGASKTIAAKYVIGEEGPEEEGGDEGEGGGCGCDCDGCKDCTGGSGDSGEGGNDDGGDSVQYTSLTQFFSMTDYNPNGITMVGLELGTDGLTATEMEFYGYKYIQIGGNGNHLKVEIYSADGTLAAGTYVPCATEGAPGPGEFNYGYDYVSDWGTSVYGSCWSTYASDAVTASEKISDGTITVEVNGDVYTITLNTSATNARYVGKLSAE